MKPENVGYVCMVVMIAIMAATAMMVASWVR